MVQLLTQTISPIKLIGLIGLYKETVIKETVNYQKDVQYPAAS